MPTVTLLAHTPDPAGAVAAAARLCYSGADIAAVAERMQGERAEEFVRMLAEMGHESPIEHASFTFGIEGVSRTFLAQITRHRLASYSVQSQRYVDKRDFSYIVPPSVRENPEALAEFEACMRRCAESYERIAEILSGGKPEARRSVLEDARFVLPGACDTRMIVTMNARSLRGFFRQRCCQRAQWEIREVACEMLRLVREVSPSLFENAGPPCLCGPCPEGKMSCGRMEEVRAAFRRMETGRAEEKEDHENEPSHRA